MICGHLIRQARLRAGLTQRELAERAGKATSVIGIANGDDGHDLG
ncbi:MAG: helix-turn-helix domain-containing protein [Acidimicrobiia bacterium]